jgi:hypothetical protein
LHQVGGLFELNEKLWCQKLTQLRSIISETAVPLRAAKASWQGKQKYCSDQVLQCRQQKAKRTALESIQTLGCEKLANYRFNQGMVRAQVF